MNTLLRSFIHVHTEKLDEVLIPALVIDVTVPKSDDCAGKLTGTDTKVW